MIAKEYFDEEFGRVAIRRIASAKYVRVRVAPGGVLQATMPSLTPVLLLKNLLHKSRGELRQAIADMELSGPPLYKDGDRIGSSHSIKLLVGTGTKAARRGLTVAWTIREGSDPDSQANQDSVRKAVRSALDAEARAYLPRRLEYLAEIGGFRYSSVRYGNAKGRWGSCSSSGVISLNVALMNTPKEIIDYVIVHELAHTTNMNHSAAFWETVGAYYPDYKTARKQLKTYTPYI